MMELKDYVRAAGRYWLTWLSVLVVAVGLAALGVALSPRTYQASAHVFASAQPSIANSAQYVQQRAQSYPDVVTGATVLENVRTRLHLSESASRLRSSIAATVPTGTSTLDITVTDRDPQRAAAIANAVATETTTVVERLETPASGVRPVTLTVSNPATAPSAPSSPKALYYLTLGALVGLFLGLAAAVVRSRMSTLVHDDRDVRRAWGPEPGPDVLAPPHGAARRSRLVGRPAAALVRRLEFAAGERPVRVLVLSPAPTQAAASRAFADELVEAVRSRGLPATAGEPGGPDADRPGLAVTLADPLAPPAFWRSAATRYDGAVLAVPSGRVAAAELAEMRVVLRAAGLEVLAVVLLPGKRRRRVRGSEDQVRARLGAPAPRRPGAAEALPAPVASGARPGEVPAGSR